ncbi:MAG: hypothetical protein P1T08_17440 [Acidimicrobiia bacterium]|nr:hypothetical protein [Acidimicrobiia bacterium]
MNLSPDVGLAVNHDMARPGIVVVVTGAGHFGRVGDPHLSWQRRSLDHPECLHHRAAVAEWLAVLAEAIAKVELFDLDRPRIVEAEPPDPRRNRKRDMDVIIEIGFVHDAAQASHEVGIESLPSAEAGEDVGAGTLTSSQSMSKSRSTRP